MSKTTNATRKIVMTLAWGIVRAAAVTLSSALRAAWAEVRATAEQTLEQVAAAAEAVAGVASASVWQDRRVYVNFAGADRAFAGCRNLKVWYDAVTKKWAFTGDKGTYPSAFIRNARAFAESVGMRNSRGGSPF